MTMRIAVLDDTLHVAEGAADWESLDAEVTFFDTTTNEMDALVERLESFDVFVTTRERTRFPREVLERLPNLKLIAGTGRRQANIDLDSATELGIPVLVTVGGRGWGNSTAELTWGLVLALARNIAWEDRQLREGRWQTRVSEGLGWKTLGILGMGKIGTIVAGFGNTFEMDVIAWGPTLDAERAARSNVEYVSWEQLFERTDVLSIHVPLTDLSRGWITARELGLMKRSAFLINTSRAQIVNQDALLEALREGRIAGAGLDVYDEEPLPADHPYLKLDNMLLTPHLGYSTGATLKQFYKASVENVQAWLDGSPINVINEDVLGHRRS
jgi:phosphoglycerate dehydrogenase-like enzyme